jgi:hypothetical protein
MAADRHQISAVRAGPAALGEMARLLVDRLQIAVADRADRRRPRPVAEMRDLPDDRAPAQVMQNTLGPACGDRDPKAAADHRERPSPAAPPR